jgi:hypothetical protein
VKKPTKRPKLNPLVIERQEVIAEVRMNSTEMVRISRVKYEGNHYTFVDLRRFWRGFDNNDNEIFHPSQKGLQLKEEDFLALVMPYLRSAQGGPITGSGPVH